MTVLIAGRKCQLDAKQLCAIIGPRREKVPRDIDMPETYEEATFLFLARVRKMNLEAQEVARKRKDKAQ